ncbi:MarR family winged helix-turn-helix transcriptional regulator [Hoeflea sp. CAU 1731]
MDSTQDSRASALRTAIDSLMRRFKIAEQEAPDGKPLNQIDTQAMLYISAHPGCGPTDIARHLNVAPTTISSVTDRLAGRNFLKRDRPDENRRAIALGLTDAGRAYVADLIAIQTHHCKLMLEQLPPDDQDLFVSLITKIAQNDN